MGRVTSGTFSPSIARSRWAIRADLPRPGVDVAIDIRGFASRPRRASTRTSSKRIGIKDRNRGIAAPKPTQWVQFDRKSGEKIATVRTHFAVEGVPTWSTSNCPKSAARSRPANRSASRIGRRQRSVQPLSGEIVEVNGDLSNHLDQLHDDPYKPADREDQSQRRIGTVATAFARRL